MLPRTCRDPGVDQASVTIERPASYTHRMTSLAAIRPDDLATDVPLVHAFRIRAVDYERATPWVHDTQILDHAFRLLSRRRIGDLLDAGGGTGALSYAIHQELGCASAVVVDASQDMLRQVPAPLQTKHAYLDDFLLGSDTEFDTILLRQVLHYLDDAPATVAGLASRLRPGGRLYISQSFVRTPAAAAWLAGILSTLSPAKRRFFHLAELRALLPSHDLALERHALHDFHDSVAALTARASQAVDPQQTIQQAFTSLTKPVAETLCTRRSKDDLFYQVGWHHSVWVRRSDR